MPDAIIVLVELTDARREELASVNVKVNNDVTYTTDQMQYGVPEYWAVAGRRGDCEDYALAKMKALRARQWPQGALDIGICKVGGEGHAVLIAHTDQGDLVLDNNHDDLRRWDNPEYLWIETSVGGSFLDWRSIDAT